MSFRLKTILGVALIEVTLLAVLVWNSMLLMRSSSEELLVQRADTTATLFASMVKDGLLSYDLATLETFVTELMNNEGLVYVRVYDQEQMLAAAGIRVDPGQPFVADTSLDTVSDGVFDVMSPIQEAGQQYGYVELGISTHQLEAQISDATWKTSSLAITEILLSALFSYLLGTWLVRQLETLRHASSEITSGRLGVQIPVKGRDEIAETVNFFNQMSLALKHSTEELNRLNASLEGQVAERTVQLEQANQSLQSIISSMSEILLVVDGQCEIQLTNPASQRLLGYQENVLLNSDARILLTNEADKERLRQMIVEQNRTGEEFNLLTSSGESLPVLMMASRVENEDGFTFTVITAQDLRELKRAEEGERYRSFQEGVNEMSANILHNIGNNLAGINGELLRIERQNKNLKKVSSLLHKFSQSMSDELESLTLKKGSVLDKAPSVLSKSGDSINHIASDEIGGALNGISSLTTHITSVIQATPLSRKSQAKQKDFDLKNLLNDVETLLRDKLDAKQILFSAQATLRVERLTVSRNLLLQAMIHLVTNSIEAIRLNGGKIEIIADQHEVEGEKQWLNLLVLDNGSGIPPEHLSEVVVSGFTTKRGGSGNGLHNVANFVKASGGKMEISNRTESTGVCVSLSLPLSSDTSAT